MVVGRQPQMRRACLTLVMASLAVVVGCQGSEVQTGTIPIHVLAPVPTGHVATPLQPNPTCFVDGDCGALITSPCARAVCNPTSHRCEAGTLPDFVVCVGGGPCAATAACLSGVCEPLTRKTCDDDNPCTADVCDPAGGCAHTVKTLAPCSDGNPCTVGDRCVAGVCAATENLCVCEADKDCASSANPCLGKMICSAAACVVDAASAIDCDDGNPCSQDTCLPATGACAHAPVVDNSPCEDGSVCTLNERCLQGTCTASSQLPCAVNDDTCPTETCDPVAGCVPSEDGLACDDGNACTAADHCTKGVCAGASTCGCSKDTDCAGRADVPACLGQLTCRAGRCEVNPNVAVPCGPSGQACVLNLCTAKGCALIKAPPGSACDDDTACTWGDTCGAGGDCVSGAALPCDDGIGCTNDACVPSVGCIHGPGGGGQACDDGVACTTGDACVGVDCVGKPTGCDDSDACTTDFCAPSGQGCIHKPLVEGASCDDGDPCTAGDRCAAGLCTPLTVQDCDDGDVCSIDLCDEAQGCTHPAVAGSPACDDGDVCTVNDACAGGKCVGEEGSCACKSNADCGAQEDGDLCNGLLVCVDHACVVDLATVVTCFDSVSPCVQVACQPNTGLCTETASAVGASCDDGDACTTAERCLVGGACGGGKMLACDDGDACTTDSCALGKGCVYAPVTAAAGVPCDDGDACTQGDVCDAGACKSGKNTCQCSKDADCVAFDDDDVCNGVLRCDAGACVSDGNAITCPPGGGPCTEVACQPKSGVCATVAKMDGALCAIKSGGAGSGGGCGLGGACLKGACVASGKPVCDDDNPCTVDSCGAANACQHAPQVGASCDDGDACTASDVCAADGACVGGKDVCTCAKDADCADDGDACNGTMACINQQCQVKVGSVVTCDTSKDGPCQVTACVPASGVCAAVLATTGAVCDDGDACSKSTVCGAGVCAGGVNVSCEDGNACTADGCNPATGCYHTNHTKACDDGDPCTLGDVCAGGACKPGAGKCECQTNDDCKAKDDGDACNGHLVCVAHSCALDPQTVVVCDKTKDGPCAANLCDTATGGCQMTAFPVGTSCDDGSVCTAKDQCSGGTCAGTVVSCDDNNPCSDDTCGAITGCKNTANTDLCDDGNPCTAGDVCAGGSCKAGEDTCGPCQTDADCASKDDGDPCNGVLSCQAGACELSAPVTCVDDGNPCTTATCQPSTGACASLVAGNGQGCDDANACTGESACLSGTCVGSAPVGCDDGESCTADSCDKTKGCVHEAVIGASCDDGNACTAPDLCGPSGGCVGGVNTCQCKTDADCAASEDGDLCNGVLVCQGNQCVVKTGSVVACDTSKDTPCQRNLCVPKTGICGLQVAPPNTLCNDGSVCTADDACKAGVCAGVVVPCDDNNVCTFDICDSKQGCTHTGQDGVFCDDGNVCTKSDVCQAGKCVGGSNVCQCTTTADCGALEDGDLCNGTLVCSAHQCVIDGKTVVTCKPTADLCVSNVCAPKTGVCGSQSLPNGASCADNDACTTAEQCFAGKCAKQSIGCDDNNTCTTDSCDAKTGCVNEPVGGIATCDDGDACTPFSLCQGGKCVGPINICFCQNNGDCKDDGDLCNGTPTCQAGRCKTAPGTVVTCDTSGDGVCVTTQCVAQTGKCLALPKPPGTSCDDNSACTAGDVCTLATCVGIPFGCDDKIGCTVDACDAKAGCVSTPKNTACDDGNVCTTDTCAAKVGCNSTPGVGPCEDGDACTLGDSCSGGLCVAGAKDPLCCVAGAPCDDGDSCTLKDACVTGICAGVPTSCDDGNACTNDSCVATSGCANVNHTDPCNDGDPCTLQDACAAGTCVGKIVFTCDDGNVCTDDSCGPTGCASVNNSGPCSDGNGCTAGDVCGSGVCSGTVTNCDDGNVCTTDFCDASMGCQTVPNAVGCSDGSLCTNGDVCTGGSCVGKAVSCDDTNPCTQDLCLATTGCQNNAKPDGATCGTAGVCLTGVCSAGSDVNPGLSCKDILAKYPAAKSGLFFIDPDGAGPGQQYEVKCDMARFGGGWMVLDVAQVASLMTMKSLVVGGACTLTSSEWKTWDQFDGATADHHFCVAEPKVGLVWPTYAELRIDGLQLVGYTGGGNNTFDAYTDCYGASWQGNFCVGASAELKAVNTSNIQLSNGQASPLYTQSFSLSQPRTDFQIRTREEGPQLEGVSWKTGAVLLR